MIWIGSLIATLVFMLLIGNLLTYGVQYSILFRPVSLSEDHDLQLGDNAEELWLDTPHHGRIHGIYFKNHQHREPRRIVLYFHGNVGNLTRWSKRFSQQFEALGVDLYMMDYRRYGKSKGPIGEQILYKDALAVYEYFAKSYEPDQIVIYGRSVGSGLASYLASVVEAKNVLLETPFTSIRRLFHSYYPFLPPWFLFRFDFPNVKHLTKSKLPIHIILSEKDRVVPLRASIGLENALKPTDSLQVVAYAGHNDLYKYDEFHEWLERHIKD